MTGEILTLASSPETKSLFLIRHLLAVRSSGSGLHVG